MRKPHLFKSGRFWFCAAGTNDHHVLRASLGDTAIEAYSRFMRIRAQF
jgi:hypothetical protein